MSSDSKMEEAEPDLFPYYDSMWKRTRGTVNLKLQRAQPFSFFLSVFDSNVKTHTEDLTLSFAELLDKSLGELSESLHINYLIEIGWLLAQFAVTGYRDKSMTLIYDQCRPTIPSLQAQGKIPNIRSEQILPSSLYSHHHSKVSVFAYVDGSIRIVVMTANLREEDWMNVTQGIWVSPKFPLKDKTDKSDGDSKTGFKKDILRYLHSYHLPLLNNWIQKIENADCSEANVFFIPSIPSKTDGPMWGQRYLQSVLKAHACIPSGKPSDWPIIGQCSSLGSLGQNPNEWLLSEFVKNLSASTSKHADQNCVPFHLIYPSVRNVLYSHGGAMGALNFFPYSNKIHKKQKWITKFMYQWHCSWRFRTKALPHIKTYCRISPCYKEISWFLLTSANLSKGAWGKKTRVDGSNLILSHEAGVLFLPQFVTGCDTFSLVTDKQYNKSPSFPLPFDVPLSPFLKDDQPWQTKFLF